MFSSATPAYIPTSGDVISRRIDLPEPIFTNRLRLIVEGEEVDLAASVGFLGAKAEELEVTENVLGPITMEHSEKE